MSEFELFDVERIEAVSIGSGRFLRSVLVPALSALDISTVVAQSRGCAFAEQCLKDNGKYEVETVLASGESRSDYFQLAGVGSLTTAKPAFLNLAQKLPQLKYIGVGVTEGGIHMDSQSMKDLAEFLYHCFLHLPTQQFSVINTDNVPENGSKIQEIIQSLSSVVVPKETDCDKFSSFLSKNVCFHNTMVDRIVAHRAGDVLVPLAEPLPEKALVIEDVDGKLPESFHSEKARKMGVWVRQTKKEMEKDRLLKLGIANGIHTGSVYLMALSRVQNTKLYASSCPEVYEYVAKLYEQDILPGLRARGIEKADCDAVYLEWIARLKHPYFGMDSYFVCQNASVKFFIRLFSSVLSNLNYGSKAYGPSPFMTFAAAVILRYLTPMTSSVKDTSRGIVFKGYMDSLKKIATDPQYGMTTWEYASDLCANLSTGVYEFRNGDGEIPSLLREASKPILEHGLNDHVAVEEIAKLGTTVSKIFQLIDKDSFDMNRPEIQTYVSNVSALYYRMISGKSTAMDVMKDVLRNNSSSGTLLSGDGLVKYVESCVNNVEVIDVHTHLFPPSHGKLMLWGIDELLTYHYLVAEYLITSPLSPEAFQALSKIEQSDRIWQSLFVERSPLSEACRGVVTTLLTLGLQDLLEKRDLGKIRAWFRQHTAESYVDLVFRLSKVKYLVMTNIPFEPEEARHWLGNSKAIYDKSRFRSALRVDQILLGDWQSISAALDALKLPHSLSGVEEFLRKWIELMEPEYFMTSIPIQFELDLGKRQQQGGIENEDLSGNSLLLNILLPLAEEYSLPIAMKFDSVRPINARLGVAGDGVKPCNVNILIDLCSNFPNVKFLATFLSRVNQHEVTIAANKFGNLHLYGCWWYCNNPSIVEEMTRMRIEILGTAFTSQHSDARVLDQLLYKWNHNRTIIGKVLVDMYQKLTASGWKVSEADVNRDVNRLFGQSYEEFMSKTIAKI